MAESKKWCLWRASCGIVIFTVSTSGYTTRSTVAIKQAAFWRGEHICSPLLPPPYLWRESPGVTFSSSSRAPFLFLQTADPNRSFL